MALIKTLAEIKQHLNVSLHNYFDDIKPYFEDAENYYVRDKILGKVLYGNLHAHYNASSLTTQEQNLLPYVQKVVAHFAYAINTGTMNVEISGAGIRQSHSENYKPAFEWAYDEAKKTIYWNAYRAVEALLVFLEENITDYPDWVGTRAFFKKRKHFCQSAIEYNDVEPAINESRRFYLAVEGLLTKVEELDIRYAIGIPYYDYLIAAMKANPTTLTAQDEVVVDMLKKVSVMKSFAMAIEIIPLDEYEIYIKQEYANQLLQQANAYMSQTAYYLNTTASPTVLSVYYGSSTYQAVPNPAQLLMYDNSATKKHFIV